jgi:hypothetical protein
MLLSSYEGNGTICHRDYYAVKIFFLISINQHITRINPISQNPSAAASVVIDYISIPEVLHLFR